jgi:glycosyltransferase involved in cell wall biosynthesis
VKPKGTIIEASHIYFGGGFILLKLLVDNLEVQKKDAVVYLKYRDIFRTLSQGNYQYISFIKTNSSATFFRYFIRRDKILFFCNLPPFTKQQKSLLYFHNPHFSKRPGIDLRSVLVPRQIRHYLYYNWLKIFSKNVDIVGCQTSTIKEDLKRIGIKATLLPFYEEITPRKEIIKYDFCYVSTVAPHKNHKNLFEAIKILARKCNFTIAVTISVNEQNSELLSNINDINNSLGKSMIINVGKLGRNEVVELYCQSRALVFPSLMETFGLPLIEALQCNLPILASDKPFTHNVVQNAIVFDPENPYSIAREMQSFLEGKYNNLKQDLLVDNKVEEIIDLLGV